MEIYRLSDADKAAYTAIGDMDSRAFIMTMVQFAHGAIAALLQPSPKAEKSDVTAQFHVLSRMALKSYNLLDFAGYVDEAIGALESPTAQRGDLNTLKASLDYVGKELLKIDSDGQGSGWAYPPSRSGKALTELEAAIRDAAFTKLQQTPVKQFSRSISSEFLMVLTASLRTLSVGQLKQLKDFSTGILRQSPPIAQEMFGSDGWSQSRMSDIKTALNACIVPSATHGLQVESDIVRIRITLSRGPERGASA